MSRKIHQKLFQLKPKIRPRHIWKQLCLFGLVALLIAACDRPLAPEISTTIDCRTIEHAAGKTCVPLNSQRLITLGAPAMANALALGVKPVGTIVYFDRPPQYLEEKLAGIALVGTSDRPNLEKILTLNPDLIIAMNMSGLPYEQISQIAPTAVDDWVGYSSWKDHFNFVAEVLGKTEEAVQVWAHYKNRIETLREALGDRYQNAVVSVLRICCNNLASDVKNSFSGTILDDAGLQRPSSQDAAGDGLVIFSEEMITQMDGDIIFIILDEDENSQKVFAQLKQKSLWNKLEAVQKGQVYPVNLATWRGGNPLAADAVIDDLFKYLANK